MLCNNYVSFLCRTQHKGFGGMSGFRLLVTGCGVAIVM